MKTRHAMSLVGGIKGLCELLGCTRAAIYQWGENVPENRQYELEVKTNKKLKSDYTLLREQDASHDGT